MSVADLRAELEKLEKTRFDAQFNVRAGNVKDYAQLVKLQRNIARVKTYLHYAGYRD
jgi:ribosomal protein L29